MVKNSAIAKASFFASANFDGRNVVESLLEVLVDLRKLVHPGEVAGVEVSEPEAVLLRGDAGHEAAPEAVGVDGRGIQPDGRRDGGVDDVGFASHGGVGHIRAEGEAHDGEFGWFADPGRVLTRFDEGGEGLEKSDLDGELVLRAGDSVSGS